MDFSQSGLEEMPALTAEHLTSVEKGGYDPRILAWLREVEQEGDRINAQDPAYRDFDRRLQYVSGDHFSHLPDAKLDYLPRISINETRKSMQAHVSALTDLKPLFSFRTFDEAFNVQSKMINNVIVWWWITSSADLALGDVIKYAQAGGTGDMGIEWDPYFGHQGMNVLVARDPRDTLAWAPGNQRDHQLWQGVTLRDEQSLAVMFKKYPTKRHLIAPARDSLLSKVKGRFRALVDAVISPAADTLAGLEQSQMARGKAKTGGLVLNRTYLQDNTLNLTGKPIYVGRGNWGYTVAPNAPVYPRGRLLVWSDAGILDDTPNPYWHGLYPLGRLKLWDLPWLQSGSPIFGDLMSVQDAINDTVHDVRVGIRKWMAPTVAYDRGAVSERFMRIYDPRRPSEKVMLNAVPGEGFKHLEGPNPQVIAQAVEFTNILIEKFRDLAGSRGIDELLRLRQSPGADTIEAYVNALTPEIRQEGRQIETFLRQPAEMVKVNIFQFMSKQQRLAISGQQGIALEDFDYDPESMVPILTPDHPKYTKELGPGVPRDERAQFFHRLFIFTVEPNSLLALNAMEQKVLRIQLFRMGAFDFWSLMDALQIGNVGQPPPIPLPPTEPPNPDEVLADIAAQAGMDPVPDPATGQLAPSGIPKPPQKYILDPMSGQLLEIRVPQTITERLMAQKLLGIGMEVNAAGRKAAGERTPKNETKKDEKTGAPRNVTTESKQS